MIEPHNIIAFDRPQRLLKKARFFLADMDVFLADTSAAADIFFEALPHADPPMALQMITLLGHAQTDRAVWPLFKLVTDGHVQDPVRRSAALQLGTVASRCVDSSALTAKLIINLSHTNASIRSGCALALGWRGNWAAVSALMGRLSDTDQDVQASAVAALCSVDDHRMFALLSRRIEGADDEERRCILLNLWRFAERVPHVQAVYLRNLKTMPVDSQLDVLAGLAQLPLTDPIVDAYRSLLVSGNRRIRLQVLDNLLEEQPDRYESIRAQLPMLLADKDQRIRQAAVRLFTSR